MEYLFTSESIISFIVLVILEIVLGIDNVIFVSIILNRLDDERQQKKARRFWMVSGIIVRSLLLMGLGWLLSQKGKSIFSVSDKGFDLASLVMLCGGLFLIYKSVKEIHAKLEGEDPNESGESQEGTSLPKALIQIVIIDAVFSFDSIITAGGTAKHVEIMIAAVVIAMIIMFLFSPKIAGFIHKHPTLKMLALSFLVMIGLSLVIEGWDSKAAHELHLKNYIYFGMAFSFGVEVLNMVMRKRTRPKPVELREPSLEKSGASGKHPEHYSDRAK
ncbi:TerC family protein [Flavihumibacter profundi]|jgi:predicted tellurium resistance membrane protein TerC|uniref:TerC family protein n=1 Tax=Flavihumibacter profundi TaxID=2716883 RepID=UPI001CC36A5B|nr:TerC family protein [Flavihumibacter profundi]MBZ5858189.1 TerC family protein [Flavihumibacter profundi]